MKFRLLSSGLIFVLSTLILSMLSTPASAMCLDVTAQDTPATISLAKYGVTRFAKQENQIIDAVEAIHKNKLYSVFRGLTLNEEQLAVILTQGLLADKGRFGKNYSSTDPFHAAKYITDNMYWVRKKMAVIVEFNIAYAGHAYLASTYYSTENDIAAEHIRAIYIFNPETEAYDKFDTEVLIELMDE